MAELLPLTALRYDLAIAGDFPDLIAPPYDVIDAAKRAELAARSPYNVVHVDLPEPAAPGGDPYANAADLLARWQLDGALKRDVDPALWAFEQDFVAPDGSARTRRGFLGRVRIEPADSPAIRPHERTHPGPKEDRLKLTRQTRTNVSPIFSLYSDPGNTAWSALAPHVRINRPFGEATDDDAGANTTHRLWPITDPNALATVIEAVAASELLIADGHHRYETARAYAEEIGGEGPHRYVLMCLVALQDPGLAVFPTHRLITGLQQDPSRQERLAEAIGRDFDAEPLPDERALEPTPASDGRVRIGYMDRLLRPVLLTLKDPAIADAALAGHAAPYRRLDTAVLEALILKRALGMSDAAIDALDRLAYARDFDAARAALHAGEADAAFFMGATPIEHVQAVARAGEHMPPKSTYFVPKVPTGLVLNPLS